jgi:hypothetical protein
MEQSAQKNRDWGSGISILLIAAIPVLYVLMLGPAARWHNACPRSMQKAIEGVYAPLVWMLDNTSLAEPLERYVELWARVR